LRRPVVGEYRTHGGGRVFIRHATPDVVTLDEVFYTRDYEFPADVSARLDRSPRVLDLGANIGLFGVFVLERFPGARITAVEPDAANAAVLRRCAAANTPEAWTIVEAAAATHEGTVPFVSGQFSLSQVAEGGEPTPAVDALVLLDDAELGKLDIEGSEWELLSDPRLAGVKSEALVVEYHAHRCPGDDPRETALELLRVAGYDARPAGRDRAGHGIVWATRP
jgi:FkbM family methyltransferase